MVRLAAIQLSWGEDKERTIEKAVQLAQLASERGGNILCFPELFTTHWFPREINSEHFSLAESIEGPCINRMRQVAREREIVLVCPFFEMDAGNRYYNSAVVVDAGGSIAGSYRKVHIPQIPLWEERNYFQPGNLGYPVFQTRFGALGVQICWDNFFPEGSRILALKGAQVICSPTAAAFASQQKWETVISGNAISNGIFILRVNRVGSEEKQDFYGRSFCVSPEGELLDKPMGLQEGVALFDVDFGDIGRVRREWAFLKDRRPDTYQEITLTLTGTVGEPSDG